MSAPVDVLAVMDAADRIEMLRDEAAECIARINGAGRTTSAESVIVSRKRVSEIRATIRETRANLRDARDAVAELMDAAKVAFEWAGPMEEAPASARPDFFNKLRDALAKVGGR